MALPFTPAYRHAKEARRRPSAGVRILLLIQREIGGAADKFELVDRVLRSRYRRGALRASSDFGFPPPRPVERDVSALASGQVRLMHATDCSLMKEEKTMARAICAHCGTAITHHETMQESAGKTYCCRNCLVMASDAMGEGTGRPLCAHCESAIVDET